MLIYNSSVEYKHKLHSHPLLAPWHHQFPVSCIYWKMINLLRSRPRGCSFSFCKMKNKQFRRKALIYLAAVLLFSPRISGFFYLGVWFLFYVHLLFIHKNQLAFLLLFLKRYVITRRRWHPIPHLSSVLSLSLPDYISTHCGLVSFTHLLLVMVSGNHIAKV